MVAWKRSHDKMNRSSHGTAPRFLHRMPRPPAEPAGQDVAASDLPGLLASILAEVFYKPETSTTVHNQHRWKRSHRSWSTKSGRPALRWAPGTEPTWWLAAGQPGRRR